jgi:CubicO group peptidase (beta-lactamase class C family)
VLELTMQRLSVLTSSAVYLLLSLPLASAADYPVEQWESWHEQNSGRCPGTTWLQYANPEDAGWSADGLGQAKEYFDSIDAAAAMVIYDGAVLAAWGEVDRRLPCHSVRKSLLNAVYGVHVANGSIDLEKTLAEIGIDDNPPLSDSDKSARVVDLLRSRSGVYHPAAYETESMKKTRPRRDSTKPGEVFWYNNWDFNALCAIFERETGTKFFEQFEEQFARPLQMQDFRLQDTYYHLEAEHSRHPAYPFRMSGRDLARIGLLFEREGLWGDQQILPVEWIRKSRESHFTKDDKTGNKNYGYGYLWWPIVRGSFEGLGMFSARGYGGHAIDVVPTADLVLVLRVRTYWDLPLPFKREKHQVKTSERFTLLSKVLDARKGPPKLDPELVPLPDTRNTPATISLPSAALAKYVGRYEVGGIEFTVTSTETGLLIGTPSTGDFSLLPLSKSDFLIEDLDVPVTFEFDANDTATRLIPTSAQ